MTRRVDPVRVLLFAVLAALAPQADAVVLTGEVQAVDAEPIMVPPSDSSPVVLRYYVADGTTVKAGDVLLRIDPGQSASRVRTLGAQLEMTRAKIARDLAELGVKRVDAEIALADAQAAVETAKLDAAVPRELISGLDYERHQGELKRSRQEIELKRRELAQTQASIARRRQDGELELERLEVERAYHAARVGSAEVRSQRAGVVVHGFSATDRGGSRFDEGESAYPGTRVGQLVSGGGMKVRAWALEPDRTGLKVGQGVQLSFDAFPGRSAAGRILAIAGAPTAKPEWGDGRYFAIDIALAGPPVNGLVPGMSVRVTTKAAPAASGASR